MKHKKTAIISAVLVLLVGISGASAMRMNKDKQRDYPRAMVNYGHFKDLVKKVEKHRKKRIVSLDEFLEMSQDENTIILDTRSREKFNDKHIEGAINLPFPEFTQRNLWDIIPPDENKRILIYCNNNVGADPINFAGKTQQPMTDYYREQEVIPAMMKDKIRDAIYTYTMGDVTETVVVPTTTDNQRSLALNIPTYINLYGYGYEDVYELNELVNINDPRVNFVGRRSNERIDVQMPVVSQGEHQQDMQQIRQ